MMSLKNIADLDARMARTTPEELSQQVEKLNEYYRSLQGLAGVPYLERIRRSSAQPPTLRAIDLRTRVTRGLLPATSSFEEAMARWKATMRVTQGLVAVRRWQLHHGGETPSSLETAVRESGLPAVPTDPYDERPIRFSVVEGQPTVYSIGPDGRDDEGQTEAIRSPYLGDVLLRLPGP